MPRGGFARSGRPPYVVAASPHGGPAAYAATAVDETDGVLTPTCRPASGTLFPLGSTTVTCTATDAAGHSTARSFPVTVHYAWSGVLQPVNANGSSIFGIGSTVPVIVKLTGASSPVTTARITFRIRRIDKRIRGTVVEKASHLKATRGHLFRFDTRTRRYQFNWSTKSRRKGTYLISLDMGDGVVRTAQFSLG